MSRIVKNKYSLEEILAIYKSLISDGIALFLRKFFVEPKEYTQSTWLLKIKSLTRLEINPTLVGELKKEVKDHKNGESGSIQQQDDN